MAPNKTILVIDDVSTIIHLIRGALIGHAVDIIAAADGGAGLALAREVLPDLILLDLALPVIDGWDVLAALKEGPETAGIPVVIVTAHGDSSSAARAKSAGAGGFVSKPFRPAELRRVIHAHLDPPVAAAS